MRKRRLLLLSLLLGLAILFSIPVQTYAADSVFSKTITKTTVKSSNARQTVSVYGLKPTITKAVSSKTVIRDVIKVNPVHACTVKLQCYSSQTSKWKTVSTYKISAGSNGKVTLQYPSTWKYSKTTKWRVYIPAVKGYKKYVSDTVVIKSTRPANANLNLGCKSAVIIRASDGYVIYDLNKDKRLANASTTKMMTALLTLEKGGLNSITSMSSTAAATGYACLDASAGTKFRVKDLLTVMLVHSSNDAAACLAEWNAGSISNFAAKMNRRARQLGCKNTHFVNPHGLDNSSHYSSAYDLALIQRECIKYSTYLDIVRRSSYSFQSVSPVNHYTFDSTDALLGTVSGFKGGKTGTTGQAGYCFCGIYKYKGVTYIYTVLGDSYENGRWDDSRKIMNFIKENYK